jgi:hypothetical protein
VTEGAVPARTSARGVPDGLPEPAPRTCRVASCLAACGQRRSAAPAGGRLVAVPGQATRRGPRPARSMTQRPTRVRVPKRSRAPRRAASAPSATDETRRTDGPTGVALPLSTHASGTVPGPISLDSSREQICPHDRGKTTTLPSSDPGRPPDASPIRTAVPTLRRGSRAAPALPCLPTQPAGSGQEISSSTSTTFRSC